MMKTIGDILCRGCGKKIIEHKTRKELEELDPEHNPFDE